MTGRIALLLLAGLGACGRAPENGSDAAAGASDSAFAAMQERGASPQAMGVDQYTSSHRFEDLPNGGRIELQRDVDDPEGVERIRTHLRGIAAAFAAGDFTIPGFVHDRIEVPGTTVMRERREAIRYDFRELPRGGEVLIRSDDPDAIRAIHAFLTFQRTDHRTHGMGGH
jgi:hypothetical protein